MEISASMVMDLRKRTGLPMMECKKALGEASGDFERAIEILRERGFRKISERAGNETPQGRVVCYSEGSRTAMLALGCETEPVTNTDDFQKLAHLLVRHAVKLDNPTPETLLAQPSPENPGQTLNDVMHDVLNRIRENIKVAAVAVAEGNVGHYIHHNGLVGVLIELSGACPDDLKSDVCMHIAAMNPKHLTREEVDAKEAESERARYREEVQGKPPQIVEKIVDGKMDRWYSEFVLLEQPFVKDDKQSVGKVLRAISPDLTIRNFHRFKIGG